MLSCWPQTAIDWFIGTLAFPLEKSPNDPPVRNILRNNYWGRADALVAMNRFEEAIAAFDKTIELATEGVRPEIRMARATALARSGDHQAAASAVTQETARLQELGQSISSMIWFDAAGALTVAASVADADPGLDRDRQIALSVELQDRAVAALREAFRLGHFREPRSKSLLLSERSRPLRAHAESLLLLKDAEAETAGAQTDQIK